MSVYRENLVVFGGGAEYNKQVKTRINYNDIKIYSTCKV